MTHTCRYSQTVGRLFLMLVLTAFCTNRAHAQNTTEVEIMVNGPFDYVEDPNDTSRVVVVAPLSDHHKPVIIFSSDNAALNPPNPTTLNEDLFYLKFTHASNKTNLTAVDLCPITQKVDNDTVVKVVSGSSKHRYAISLPKPDYYTTYKGRYGRGLSQSIVSPNPIPIPNPNMVPVPDPLAKYYTVWMVLHYRFTGTDMPPTAATLTGTRSDGTTYKLPDVAFSSVDGDRPLKAISIQQAGKDDMGNSPICDTYSHHSFLDSLTMWGLTNHYYALFPKLTGSTAADGQIEDDFDYGCPQSSQREKKFTTKEKKDLCKKKGGDFDGGMCMMSTGSADCHKCQISINGVVQ